MGIKAGLVGLPNVGKSTLFNALTKSQVPAENYPFCTIDPHVAITPVPDERLAKLQQFYGSKKIIPATMSFVDIAGLVKGAASGEGLGNQFLSHIREVDLILHVLRCFDDPDVIRAGGEIAPFDDYQIILAELVLKDLESIEKRLEKVAHQIKAHQSKPDLRKAFEAEQELLRALGDVLGREEIAKAQELLKEASVETVPLLSIKKFLILANVAENDLEDEAYKNNQYYQVLVEQFGANSVIPISAKLEYELQQLPDDEAAQMRSMMHIAGSGLETVVTKTFATLGLITFFTCGPQEVHAWPIPANLNVRDASGEIHTDLQRGFISADVFNCADLFALGTPKAVREDGKMRAEGQEYVVQDGDIILVKFNV